MGKHFSQNNCSGNSIFFFFSKVNGHFCILGLFDLTKNIFIPMTGMLWIPSEPQIDQVILPAVTSLPSTTLINVSSDRNVL